MSDFPIISGTSPPPGSPERQADALEQVALQLRRQAEVLEVLADEVRSKPSTLDPRP